MDHLLDIGEVARATGLPPSTLRYYEDAGLIACSSRKGLRRQYPQTVLERLSLILLARDVGFQLDDIRVLVGGRLSARDVRERLLRKADELDLRIRQMEGMRDRLRHAANCRSERLLECPHFRRGLASALEQRQASGEPTLRAASRSRSRTPANPTA